VDAAKAPTADAATWRGILFFLAAWTVVPNIDVAAKLLGQWGYPVLLAVWARFAMSLVILSPALLTRRRTIFTAPPDARMHVLRAALLAVATFGFFLGLKTMSIADALATYFVYPFLVTALSPLFLGERPGWRRWTAVGFGFVGSLIVIRPTLAGVPAGTLYVLGAALAFAGYNLLTRGLSRQADPWQTLTFQSLVGFAITSVALPWIWQAPDLPALGLMLMLGAAATLGHYLLIRAYMLAPAPVLAPFAYFEIVVATALGYLVFGDFPDRWTWAGVAVIAVSGIVIALRERRAPSDTQA
jgi:drug/metabolite transporter (DMT)-like permease